MMDENMNRLRDLHVETEYLLTDLEGMINALEIAIDAHPTLAEAHPVSSAIFTLVGLIKRSVGEVTTARRMEWVGLGGHSEMLTAKQIAEARGEVAA